MAVTTGLDIHTVPPTAVWRMLHSLTCAHCIPVEQAVMGKMGEEGRGRRGAGGGWGGGGGGVGGKRGGG